VTQEPSDQSIHDVVTLLDWKRRVFALYGEVRASPEPEWAWRRWREARHELFAAHPQSPIPSEKQTGFAGLAYHDYDPAFRMLANVVDAEREEYDIPTSGDQPMRFTRRGIANFELQGRPMQLELYWLNAYGGGLFVPFRDGTSGNETYGAGRYLEVPYYDDTDEVELDFNMAYNPSCAFSPVYDCPYPPASNRLSIAIPAGEMLPFGKPN